MESAKILLVDNDPEFLRTRSQLLQRTGYQVSQAANPADALRLINETRPDIVVIDVRLRNDNDEDDYSGIDELAIPIQDKFPRLPIVIMSAHFTAAKLQDLWPSVVNGLLSFWSKSADDEMLRIIDQALKSASNEQKDVLATERNRRRIAFGSLVAILVGVVVSFLAVLLTSFQVFLIGTVFLLAGTLGYLYVFVFKDL